MSPLRICAYAHAIYSLIRELYNYEVVGVFRETFAIPSYAEDNNIFNYIILLYLYYHIYILNHTIYYA